LTTKTKPKPVTILTRLKQVRQRVQARLRVRSESGLVGYLLPSVDPEKRDRWASQAPEIAFRSAEALVETTTWQARLDAGDAARHVITAASAGVVDAQVALARMYLTGSGVGKDPRAAISWLEKAAATGSAEAINMLGRCHEHGWGTERNAKAASLCYEQAAAMGYAWSKFNLADLCARGDGVARDDTRAFALYREAADAGIEKAFNMLGLFHESGRATALDRAEAKRCYERGAASGDCWAQFNLARLLTREGDLGAAIAWLNRALDAGFPDFWRTMRDSLAATPWPEFRELAQKAAASLEGIGEGR
jgi:FOG: TPR repeat, SEL1 subfamily